MYRVTFIIMVLIVMFASLAAPPIMAEQSLLQNGGFEDQSAGVPLNWTHHAWVAGDDAARFSVDISVVHGGGASVVIENLKPNDASWSQTVTVKPKTMYRLSGWINVSKAANTAKGANLSVLGVIETSRDLFDTKGSWVKVELYGKTGDKQTEVQVAARVGGYGSLNTGKAYFDDIEFTEVSAAPAGTHVIAFEPGTAAAPAAASGGGSDVSAFPVILIAILFALLYLLVYAALIRRDRNSPLYQDRGYWLVCVMLAIAFFLRLVMAVRDPGHPTDMGTFTAWALRAYQVGLGHFYKGATFEDYPPGYIYVLYAVGAVSKWFGVDPSGFGMRLLVKLPPILADLASAFLIFRFGRSAVGAKTTMALAFLFAFNPAIWVDSAAWGQVDSVYALTLIVSLIELSRCKWNRSAVWYAVTVMIKPQALIVAPVLLLALIRHGGGWRKSGLALLSGLAAFVALLLPFSTHQGPFWIVGLYKTTLASYPYASLNAFNLFALAGANWLPVQGKLLSVSYQAWGTFFMILALAWNVWLYVMEWRSGMPVRPKGDARSKRAVQASVDSDNRGGTAVLLALMLLVAIFLLGPKMHERYMYPSVLLVLFAFLKFRDRRLLHLFLGFSVTQYWNIGYVLEFARIQKYQIPGTDGLMMLTSLLNVILLGYLGYVVYDLIVRRRLLPVEGYGPAADDAGSRRPARAAAAAVSHETGPLSETEWNKRFTRNEWLLLCGLTLLYAAVALYHLGFLSAPQSYWQSASAGDGFTVEFAQPQQFNRIYSFGGAGDYKFRVDFSMDGKTWTGPVTVDQSYVKNFAWNMTTINVTARFARVTAENAGLMLEEIAFYPQGSDHPAAIKEVTGEGQAGKGSGVNDPRRAIDEQEKVVTEPGFMNQTYFDEIYHARTAFEYLHAIQPYETTHPPFGKILISLGILVFGMDPFGWRIAGTLFGIAMIPVIYLFARRLFGKAEYAFAAAFLMTFDFMHFAQTRIATIDVFAVFFIILMFYFMYRYYMLNFYRVPLRQTLVPLFWSGFFFGVGAASKWIAVYGGAGLALIFFLSLYERFREYEAAVRAVGKSARGAKHKSKPSAELEFNRHIALAFPLLSLQSVLWCGLFFIIIPALLYSASFLPVILAHGEELSFHRLIQYQKSMYDYHTQLKATHTFASPWYQWPFMHKPMWFYAGQFVPPGKASSIVSMGNPAIWWVGTFAVVASIFIAIRRKHRGMLVVLIAFFSQYVPWMLVPRLTFIYHFFAMVPFLILSLVYVIRHGLEVWGWKKRWVYAYYGVVAALFVMFYPVLSGMAVNKGYVEHSLRWFQSWIF